MTSENNAKLTSENKNATQKVFCMSKTCLKGKRKILLLKF